MLTTTTIHEKVTARIIAAIEKGQTPPWRRPWRPDLENTGFPCVVDSQEFGGIAVLLLNLSAMQKNLASKFWATQTIWQLLGGRVSGEGTLLPNRLDPNQWITVFNADQVCGGKADRFRSRRRSTSVAADYLKAEAVVKASGADIRFSTKLEAAYHFPPNDYIVFPFREQFFDLSAYYDSLFHELSHYSEPRLDWNGSSIIREWRAEIAAPFLASQLGIPVLADMKKLTNHCKHLDRWVRAMKEDPTLIFKVADAASECVAYLLSLRR